MTQIVNNNKSKQGKSKSSSRGLAKHRTIKRSRLIRKAILTGGALKQTAGESVKAKLHSMGNSIKTGTQKVISTLTKPVQFINSKLGTKYTTKSKEASVGRKINRLQEAANEKANLGRQLNATHKDIEQLSKTSTKLSSNIADLDAQIKANPGAVQLKQQKKDLAYQLSQTKQQLSKSSENYKKISAERNKVARLYRSRNANEQKAVRKLRRAENSKVNSVTKKEEQSSLSDLKQRIAQSAAAKPGPEKELSNILSAKQKDFNKDDPYIKEVLVDSLKSTAPQLLARLSKNEKFNIYNMDAHQLQSIMKSLEMHTDPVAMRESFMEAVVREAWKTKASPVATQQPGGFPVSPTASSAAVGAVSSAVAAVTAKPANLQANLGMRVIAQNKQNAQEELISTTARIKQLRNVNGLIESYEQEQETFKQQLIGAGLKDSDVETLLKEMKDEALKGKSGDNTDIKLNVKTNTTIVFNQPGVYFNGKLYTNDELETKPENERNQITVNGTTITAEQLGKPIQIQVASPKSAADRLNDLIDKASGNNSAKKDLKSTAKSLSDIYGYDLDKEKDITSKELKELEQKQQSLVKQTQELENIEKQYNTDITKNPIKSRDNLLKPGQTNSITSLADASQKLSDKNTEINDKETEIKTKEADIKAIDTEIAKLNPLLPKDRVKINELENQKLIAESEFELLNHTKAHLEEQHKVLTDINKQLQETDKINQKIDASIKLAGLTPGSADAAVLKERVLADMGLREVTNGTGTGTSVLYIKANPNDQINNTRLNDPKYLLEQQREIASRAKFNANNNLASATKTDRKTKKAKVNNKAKELKTLDRQLEAYERETFNTSKPKIKVFVKNVKSIENRLREINKTQKSGKGSTELSGKKYRYLDALVQQYDKFITEYSQLVVDPNDPKLQKLKNKKDDLERKMSNIQKTINPQPPTLTTVP